MKLVKSLLIALALCAVVLPAQASLVAYYTFDGDDATDTSGNANNGTLGSTTAFSSDTPGVLGGRSAVGDGSNNSFISVTSSASLESITNNLTVALWVKATTGDNGAWVRLMRKGDEEGNEGTPAWMLNRNNNTANAYIRIDPEPSAFNQNRGNGGAVFDGTWHHLSYTLDSGTWQEYIDGSPTSNGSYTNASLSNTGLLTLLGRTDSVLNGLMDDVSIWNETLEAAQIGQLAGGASALSLIPEPSSAMLLLLGATPLLRRRR